MKGGPSLVLLYHRIAHEPVDPLGMCVSPARFEEHLEVLQRVASVVPASGIGTAPPRSVAITFDDGYADVFTEALPRLARREMPSAVFLVTEALERGSPFWWDVLVAAVFDQDPREPLLLTIDGKTRRLALGSRLSKRIALRLLLPRLRAMRQHERDVAIAELKKSLPPAAMDRLPEVARRDDVRSVSGDLLEVGSHTCSHPSLSAIEAADRSAEIAGSKRILEEQLGVQVDAFAYPFGARDTFDDPAVADVREAGYRCAFTNVAGSFRPGDDVFRVPRRVVGDWPGPVFERRLRRWLGRG